MTTRQKTERSWQPPARAIISRGLYFFTLSFTGAEIVERLIPKSHPKKSRNSAYPTFFVVHIYVHTAYIVHTMYIPMYIAFVFFRREVKKGGK
jgi:hypothetical protein